MLLEIINFVHFVGLAWGLGGATAAAIISAKAERDKETGLAMMKVLPVISKLIWFGLILLIISGIALLFYIKWPIDRQLLIIKHFLVLWILIIGIIIGVKIKRMSIITLNQRGKPSPELFEIRREVRGLGMINLFLWYAITLLSVFV